MEFINCEFLNNNNLFQDPVTDSIRFLFRNCKFTPAGTTGAVMQIICKHAPGRKIGGLDFENCTVVCDPVKNPPLFLAEHRPLHSLPLLPYMHIRKRKEQAE